MKTLQKYLTGMFLFLLSLTSSSQTLDEIVAKHIEAVGGKDNWGKIKTIRKESVLKQGGAEIRITSWQVDKKASRSDISVMGMTGFNIVKNQEGWNYYPWEGHMKSEAMTADDIKNEQDGLYIQDEFITSNELGKKLEYFGMDDIDGTECFKIKMTDKNQKEATYYIDPDNYLIIKKTEKTKADGKERENSSFFSDYKRLNEGIMYPMNVNSGWGESETTKIEINPVIDESSFKPAK